MTMTLSPPHFGLQQPSVDSATKKAAAPVKAAKATVPIGGALGATSVTSGKTALPKIPANMAFITAQIYHPDWATKHGLSSGGGLAQVATSISAISNKLGANMVCLGPLYNGMKDKVGFQPTDIAPITVKGPDCQDATYQVFYKNEGGRLFIGLWNEAIDKMTKPEDAKMMEIPFKELPEDVRQDLEGATGHAPLANASSGATPTAFKSQDKKSLVINPEIYRQNAAMAKLLPQLDGPKENAKPWQFKGGADAVIANDWMDGGVLRELAGGSPQQKAYYDKVSSLFYVHNVYDSSELKVPVELAEKLGVTIPEDIKAEFEADRQKAEGLNQQQDDLPGQVAKKIMTMMGLKPKTSRKTSLSSMRDAVRYAKDGVVINERFLQSITGNRLPVDPGLAAYLMKKQKEGKLFDMAHAVSPQMTPVNNEFLTSDGFSPMPDDLRSTILKEKSGGVSQKHGANATHATRETFKKWKIQQKLALQKQLGLPQKADALLLATQFRFDDVRQKGSLQIIHTLEKFLSECPDAQFILNTQSNPAKNPPWLEGFIQQVQNNPKIKDQVAFVGWTKDQLNHRLRAGCDIVMTPSVYEPYGLTQYEPLENGTAVLVSGRDGLSEIYDPTAWPTYNHRPGEAHKSQYGQTGYVNDHDLIPYRQVIDQFGPEYAELPSLPAVRKTNEAFLKTLKRANDDVKSGKIYDVGMNGLRMVREQHNIDRIADYYVPIFNAILQKKETPKLEQTA